MDLFDNPQPPWMDESCAGSLFPQAHPARPARIVSDGNPRAPLLSEMRANHDARLARVNAAREREETAEERDARWRAARTKALDDIRRERRLAREMADRGTDAHALITGSPPPGTWAYWSEEWVREVSVAVGVAASQIADAVNGALASFSVSAKDMADGMRALQQASLQPWARDDAPNIAIGGVIRALGETSAPSEPAWPARRRKRADGKVPQSHEQHARDRYLPGTRHSGKGGRW